MKTFIALLWCASLALFPVRAATTTLLPFGAAWSYFDEGYLPSADWAQSALSDAGWEFGTAPLGYGDGDEATVVNFGFDDEHKFVTTYFRRLLTMDAPSQYESILLELTRDDGAVVYVNGNEVFRSNMPTGTIAYSTYASTGLLYDVENAPVSVALSPAWFVQGENLIAVEVHQFEPASPDLSFDLRLTGDSGETGATITRQPYLQVGTSSNLIVRWRTSAPTTTRVRYGTNPANLNLQVSNTARVADHEITLTGLMPDTKYFYDVGTVTNVLAGDSTYYFVSAPIPGTEKPTRIWAIGDAGTGYQAQYQVRDAYSNFTSNRHTDVWLMLGDNAYSIGLDHEYQANMFNVYPTMLRQFVLWPTIGNHETAGNANLSDDFDYYRIFTMPTAGQAGGVPSGTEHYYSYDYANIHFVCLDSMTTIYREPNGAMAQWLHADLANTTRDWIIAYFHHPPYTHASHNSDYEGDLIAMRANIVPILEYYGVDLVLAGHSHAYERSYLIDGLYGPTANPTNYIDRGDGRTNGTGAYWKAAGGMGARRGTVYIVDGSSGGQGGGGTLDHPVMYYSALTYGSLVLDITGQRLDAKFLSAAGTVDDSFTILKEAHTNAPQPILQVSRSTTNAILSWPTTIPDYLLESKSTVNAPNWSPVNLPAKTNGRRKAVAVPVTETQKFFQLRRQP